MTKIIGWHYHHDKIIEHMFVKWTGTDAMLKEFQANLLFGLLTWQCSTPRNSVEFLDLPISISKNCQILTETNKNPWICTLTSLHHPHIQEVWSTDSYRALSSNLPSKNRPVWLHSGSSTPPNISVIKGVKEKNLITYSPSCCKNIVTTNITIFEWKQQWTII